MSYYGPELHRNKHDNVDDAYHCDCTNQDVYGDEGWKFTDDVHDVLRDGFTGDWSPADIQWIAEDATDRAWLLGFHDQDGLNRCLQEADKANAKAKEEREKERGFELIGDVNLRDLPVREKPYTYAEVYPDGVGLESDVQVRLIEGYDTDGWSTLAMDDVAEAVASRILNLNYGDAPGFWRTVEDVVRVFRPGVSIKV